jgi:hypothetical protein
MALKGLPGDAVTISANGPTTPVVLTRHLALM